MWYKLDCWLKRRRHEQQAQHPVLNQLYRRKPPSSTATVVNTRFLAVDCEMTGLDPKHNSLLSIGWVEVKNLRIQLGTARHYLIAGNTPVGSSATIHGILDRHMQNATATSDVLEHLCREAVDKVAVFHHGTLDAAFIQKAARTAFGGPLYLSYVDTMQIEKRRLNLKNLSAPLNLSASRERYNLPPSQEHDALADAIATAELFIAQCAHMGNIKSLQLKELGIRCI